MDMKLEVLVVPVSDVDRAKRFYETLGFRLDGRNGAIRRGCLTLLHGKRPPDWCWTKLLD